MRGATLAVLLCFWLPSPAAGGPPDSVGRTRLTYDQILGEAVERNPEILAARRRIEAASARIASAGALDDPELTYMREEMPGFQWDQAVKQRFGIMQMIRFPSKLTGESELARNARSSTLYGEAEKINALFLRLRMAYDRWWYSQQVQGLKEENLRLLRQMADLARTRYSAGSAMLQEVLKSQVEIARAESDLTAARLDERSSWAMIAALVDRPAGDSLHLALLSEAPRRIPALDSLEMLALRNRPMLLADSLAVEDGKLALSLARAGYLPDLRLGVEYVTFPSQPMTGWNVYASVSIPFAPWTLGKAGGRVEEATATIGGAEQAYRATRLMLLSSVRETYARAESGRERELRYRSAILPQAQRALEASLASYRAGQGDIVMLLDSYRMYVDLSMEHRMTRMTLEDTLAELELTAGAIPRFLSEEHP